MATALRARRRAQGNRRALASPRSEKTPRPFQNPQAAPPLPQALQTARSEGDCWGWGWGCTRRAFHAFQGASAAKGHGLATRHGRFQKSGLTAVVRVKCRPVKKGRRAPGPLCLVRISRRIRRRGSCLQDGPITSEKARSEATYPQISPVFIAPCAVFTGAAGNLPVL